MKKILIAAFLIFYSCPAIFGTELETYRYSILSPDCWKGSARNFLFSFLDNRLYSIHSEAYDYHYAITEDRGLYQAEKRSHAATPNVSILFRFKDNRKKLDGFVVLHGSDKTCRIEGERIKLTRKGDLEDTLEY